MIVAGIAGSLLAVSVIINIILFIRKRGNEIEIRYIDKSGIASNPPSFLETKAGKTLNIDFDGTKIIINHFPIWENLEIISKIAGIFQSLKVGADLFYNKPLTEIESVAYYQIAYEKLINLLIKILRPHLSRKELKKFKIFARENSNGVFEICAEIFDFWQYMGKLTAGMGQGLSPRLQYGERLTSDSLKWDDQGERLIQPRYVSTFQSLKKKQSKMKSEENTQNDKQEKTPDEVENNGR